MERVSTEQAQQAIMQRIVEAYPKYRNLHLEYITPRDRPDFEATIKETDERIGIEVTGLYQDEREAKINYNEIPDWGSQPLIVDSIVAALNLLLKKKATSSQNYQFDGRMFLAIWTGSFVFNTPQDFNLILPLVSVPDTKFSEIWLVLRDRNTSDSVLLALR